MMFKHLIFCVFVIVSCKSTLNSSTPRAVESELSGHTKIVVANDSDDISLDSPCQTALYSGSPGNKLAPKYTRILWFTLETIERKFWFDSNKHVVLFIPYVLKNCETINEIREKGGVISKVEIDLVRENYLVTFNIPNSEKKTYQFLKSITYKLPGSEAKEIKYDILNGPFALDERGELP